MATRLDAMLELERRGKLPADMQPYLDEARRRGLVPEAGTSGKAAASPPNDFGSSHAGQAISGVNEGLADLVGLPLTATNAVLQAGPAGINALFGTNFQAPQLETMPFLGTPSADTLKRSMRGAGLTAEETGDPTKRITRRIGQQVGASLIPVGRAGTLGKEAALGLFSGTGAGIANEVAPGNPWADLIGQVAGAATAAGAVKLGARALTPFPASAGRVRAANVLEGEGVELTAGQKTGNKKLQYLESELGGEEFVGKQGEQFTSAALKRVGINSNRATTQVMADAFEENGKQFRELEAYNDLIPDRELGSDLAPIVNDYRSIGGTAPVIDEVVRDVIAAAKVGAMNGAEYQALTSRLARLARETNDGTLRTTLYALRHALDDAMERSIAKNNPDDLGRWKAARRDYFNLLTIEDAVARSGPDAASGIITPANLRSAVQRKGGKRAYVTGRGDFNELAHAGAETMTPLPNSGTASRLAVRGLPATIGAALGSPGGIPGAIGGAIAGAAVPALMGKAVLSKTGRKYLGNQRVRPAGPLPKQGLAANAAITLSGQREQPKTVTLRELINSAA